MPSSSAFASKFAFSLSLLVPILGALALPSTAWSDRIYQEIEIPWPADGDLGFLTDIPDLEVMGMTEGESIRLLSRPDLTGQLLERGHRVAVRVEDLQEHYTSSLMLADNFGRFYTYSEMVDFLDSLHTEFPSITTEKDSIGTTWEGRTIWAMKISDSPDLDEDEPEVLFDALHHARETITLSVLLNFMRFLCGEYGNDPHATFLVDQREIWFIPVVNPDGYVYNETIAPNGGGMWRKNRRDDAVTAPDVGVDLNRNYAVGFGGAGSSGSTYDETYRGPNAFSEPETQTVRDFIVSRNFVTHNSYHSVMGVVLFPWGYTATPPPDIDTYNALAEEMTRLNGYPYGSVAAMLDIASGGTFDWTYGDTLSKPKMFSFSTEVDGSGFWPAESEIPSLLAQNLWPDIYLSLVAGSYIAPTQSVVSGGNGNDRLDPDESADLTITLKNDGLLAGASGVSLTLASDDSYIQIVDAASSYGALAAGAAADNGADPFVVSVDSSAPDGHEAVFTLAATWNGGGTNVETITLTVGRAPAIVSDDFESGNNGWSQGGGHTASTGAWVLIDPNATNYQPEDDTSPDPGVTAWITGQNSAVGVEDVDGGVASMISPTWDLSAYSHVTLDLNYFHGQRDPGDDSGDFFAIDLSNDGGASFPVNLVSIGDVSSPAIWTGLRVDLDSALALTSQMALRFQASDGAAGGDIIEGGLDDLRITDDGTGNRPPGAPALVSPADGAPGELPNVALTLNAAADPEGDSLSYSFRVYSDALLTTPVRSVDRISPAGAEVSWPVDPPLPDGVWYWRAFADDGEERGPFMASASFTTDLNTSIGRPLAGDPRIYRPSPNPFRTGTTIRFGHAAAGRVIAEVFDVNGRRVRSLHRGLMPAGARELTWDGRNSRGLMAAAGVYFVRLRTADRNWSVKVTLLP